MFVQESELSETKHKNRQGWLRHGNPPGDLSAVRRCGARTRSGGCCRQPAMKNGRCRLHGGKSTGPRTVEGLARSRTARLVHGGCTAEIIALKREARQAARRTAFLVSLTRLRWAQEKQANRPIDPMSGETGSRASLGEFSSEPQQKGRNRAMNPMSGENPSGKRVDPPAPAGPFMGNEGP